ncbi:M48 family metallopeptidase [Mechercharimyces sp. CAU 1602]|uniref:tetratricopeptide repeat protein n=1 Tax=Mechercharimyces sp. CAU 1602 TaxID=2973933 RepID=UPI002162ED3C|nr:tetratricopeptide repeat protein [Mechercharimyces sp. CAU 1602]MCS1351750.1 tetratricopeptide repeat protein [Mechercharimyces sp. CAU 1602]
MQSSFLSAILHLKEETNDTSIWCKNICRALPEYNFSFDFTRVPYHLNQVMEPTTLFEVAQVANLSLEQVSRLEYPLDGPIETLQKNWENRSHFSPLEQLNIAFHLTAISRFEQAWSILTSMDRYQLTPCAQLYFYLLTFVIKNRLGVIAVDEEFTSIKHIITENTIPASIQLNMSSQAIVWYIKQKSVKSSLYQWFVQCGLQAKEKLSHSVDFQDYISLSTFHRAYAMIPAEEKKVEETREIMKLALHYAMIATPRTPLEEVKRADAMKTAYESEVKEHLYLSRQFSLAEQAGRNLIELDPHWSISYQELAEVYSHFKRFDEALDMYHKAATIGLPRLTFSHFMSGYTLSQLQRDDEAIAAYQKTLDLDPENISAGVNALQLARKTNHPDSSKLELLLQKWDEEGILTDAHRSFLARV